MPVANEKTTTEHWDRAWSRPPRMRLPSSLNIGTRNLQCLLRRYVRPGMRFMEIGCAPGKVLAWVAKVLRAEVAGLDYSRPGINYAHQLFDALGLEADLRCENVFDNTFPRSSFDVVYSAGVIEHFDDPRPIIQRHLELLRPGGTALITVPHYGGVYGSLQRHCDPHNLAIHNLSIMAPGRLADLAPRDEVEGVRQYPFGRLSPWLVNLDKQMPGWLSRGCSLVLNAVGLAQPCDISVLCPMLVLAMQRRGLAA